MLRKARIRHGHAGMENDCKKWKMQNWKTLERHCCYIDGAQHGSGRSKSGNPVMPSFSMSLRKACYLTYILYRNVLYR